MVTIYALMSGQLVLYVGKTKKLTKREREHRCKKGNSCSKYIPDYTDWTMKVLEETTDALGTSREQYFYDTLKPLYNHCRPGQTRKETLKAYRQSDVAKAHTRTEEYKEYKKAYDKAYRQRTKLKSLQD